MFKFCRTTTVADIRTIADASMIPYYKKYIKTIRLNSFHPLCSTELGRQAISKYNFSPFIDASCRREPDFENEFPSISALCRQELFAPNLYQNDIIVYITVQGSWYTDYPHYRLVAILEVHNRRESHNLGQNWYTNQGLPVPSNCMVPDNEPLPFDKTAGDFNTGKELKTYLARSEEQRILIGSRRVKLWNEAYMKRSKDIPVFIITKTIFKELDNPPVVTIEDMKSIFGKVPNTRNPNIIKKDTFKKLAAIAGVEFNYDE